MFHLHKWKEYKDIKTHVFYRICTKCGVVEQWVDPECYYLRAWGEYMRTWECRTNDWKPVEIATLIEDEEASEAFNKLKRVFNK